MQLSKPIWAQVVERLSPCELNLCSFSHLVSLQLAGFFVPVFCVNESSGILQPGAQ